MKRLPPVIWAIRSRPRQRGNGHPPDHSGSRIACPLGSLLAPVSPELWLWLLALDFEVCLKGERPQHSAHAPKHFRHSRTASSRNSTEAFVHRSAQVCPVGLKLKASPANSSLGFRPPSLVLYYMEKCIRLTGKSCSRE